MYSWTTPVRYIRKIGPTKAKELMSCGIETVGDLLEKQPLSYIFPGTTDIADAKEGMVVIRAKVVSIKRAYDQVVKAEISDDTGTIEVIWYHSPWLLEQLRPGTTATFYGKYKNKVLLQPKWTTVESTMENIYGGQYGVHHDTIRAALKEVLSNLDVPRMYNGDSRVGTFKLFHFPPDSRLQRAAVFHLKKDEALTLQTALAEKRKGREGVKVPYICIGGPKTISYFPYQFTGDQKKAINTIRKSLTSGRVMQHLVHGEVGSGKSAVAFYCAIGFAEQDKRTLILCPTTILAQQHYDTLRGMGWEDVMLYTDWKSVPKLLPKIIIGTHALLNWDWLLEDVSLVITDEFQKFGVAQRATAQRHHPHLLLMSATPIPRTLAATVFGDLDVSTIRELPIKRGTVVTKWVLPEKREAMYEIIEKELAKGKQAYVVYPRISGDEDVVSAISGLTEIRKRFNWCTVEMLTGTCVPEQKSQYLRQFKAGRTQILVSTIIAEVGLDNSNATVMVIEGADRFGLSSLHQLRGRVCRSTDTAFCFLVSETSNPTSIARLEVIEKCNCGFTIAEEDLRLRGAGEVFSTRQTGLPALRWCSVVDDYDLMIEAKEIVNAGSVGSGVVEMVRLKYGESLELGGVV